MPGQKTYESPMCNAILERISSANGSPVTKTDLLLMFPSATAALAQAHAELVDAHLAALVSAKKIINAGAGLTYTYWTAAPKKAPKEVADEVADEEADEGCPSDSPSWVGQPAAPRTYNVMDPKNVYVPPPSLCKGSKSVREEIEGHPDSQAATYIPVL